MNFGRTPWAARSSSRVSRASMRRPCSSSGAPTILAPAPAEARQRAAIGVLLDDDRVARVDQQLVDEVEPLQRARGDQHLVGVGRRAAVARQLVARRPRAARAGPAGRRRACRWPARAPWRGAGASPPRSAPRPGCRRGRCARRRSCARRSPTSVARRVAGRGPRAARSRRRSSGVPPGRSGWHHAASAPAWPAAAGRPRTTRRR